MNLGMFGNLLLMACGIYMMYWAVQMKMTNEIPEMMVGKRFPLNRAKDPEGFIKASYPVTMIAGAILIAIGLIEALEILVLFEVLNASLSLVVVAVVIGYGMILLKLQKKYLLGIVDEKKKKK